MKLKPIIASYSGESYARMKQYLDDPVLDVIARVARSPQPSAEIPRQVIAELVEMHVLVEQDGLVRLNTAVFLKDDIEDILSTVAPLAQEFARRILECGVAFRHAPAEVTVFLAGILGVVQGMGWHMSQKGIGSAEWKEYAGKYARSKVDFDELCDIYETIGPDYLNKTVLPGERYTAVFIGPGGINFQSLNDAAGITDVSKIYAGNLNRYLVDAYAELVSGKIQSEALYAAAEAAHLYQQGKLRSAVITQVTLQEYGDAVRTVMEAAASYWDGKLVILDELLRSTTSGRQGVSPGNMMMHLWRYVRKVTARALYENGFFTDSIPQDGCLTVFYENDVELIRQLLL